MPELVKGTLVKVVSVAAPDLVKVPWLLKAAGKELMRERSDSSETVKVAPARLLITPASVADMPRPTVMLPLSVATPELLRVRPRILLLPLSVRPPLAWTWP